MDPKPVGRIPADCSFKRAVHVDHNGGGRPGLTILMGGNFRAAFDPPLGQPNTKTNAGMQRAIVTQRKQSAGC
jgi:hypothetical protein